MIKKITLTFTFLLVAHFHFSQSPGKAEQYHLEKHLDSSAEYPGGMEAFYQYMQARLVYPMDARQKEVQGKTFVEFIVDASGYIIPGSVKTIKSLLPSCDAEAVRVISSCKTQWKPAQKNGQGANQKFILPVAFALTEGPPHPLHAIKSPIKTVVIKKPFASKDSLAWSVYSDAGTSVKTGTVPVGDSVVVMGWAPWAYYIQSTTICGYISWKALMVTDELKLLSEIVAEHSQKEYDNSLHAPYGSANALLSITANQQSVYTGQCIAVTLSFDLNVLNTIPLQFRNLGSQLQEILATLPSDNCYTFNSGLNDIVAEDHTINETKYTRYPIYKANYCPINPEPIVFNPIKLVIAKIRPHADDPDSLITFTTKPLMIKVNALPQGMATSVFDGFPLVGKFQLTDSLIQDEVHAGEAVTYKVTIEGEGLTFPVIPPDLQVDGVTVQLHDIIDTQHWTGGQPKTSKTFLYKLIFGEPGIYDFRQKITFRSFNVETKKIDVLKSGLIVKVSPSKKGDQSLLPKHSGLKNQFIAIDVSQSMSLEDYTPHRLGAVKAGLKQFLTNRENCDIGLIVFAGDARHLNLSSRVKCYNERLIDSIDLKMSGTAIGDAIWLAKNSFPKNQLPKKLVIIGDGDQNAGHISPRLAATLAKKYNITIDAIGVGTSGPVPLGQGTEGRTNWYSNTFSDKDFKTITALTGGQYYWAINADDLNRILKMIFE